MVRLLDGSVIYSVICCKALGVTKKYNGFFCFVLGSFMVLGGWEWLKAFPIETNTSQPAEPATKNSAFQWTMDQTGVRKLNSLPVSCLANQSTWVLLEDTLFMEIFVHFHTLPLIIHKVLNFEGPKHRRDIFIYFISLD